VKNLGSKYIGFLLFLSQSSQTIASSQFSQLVFSFPNKREIQVTENPTEPSIEILFEKTTLDELAKINFYDETFVHRAILTELNPQGTKLKLILKYQDVKANIAQFEDPPRVVLDLFDSRYQLERDPRTSLPLVNLPQGDAFDTQAFDAQASDTKASDTRAVNESNKLQNRQPSLSQKNVEVDLGKRSVQPSGKPTSSLPTLELVGSSSHSNQRLDIDFAKLKEGRGPQWEKYPVYLYPLQTAVYHGRSQQNESKKEITTGQSLAEYGLKLFNLGHETRALEAYKNVLHKEPQVFDGDPLHLWAVAEIYLGAGELTLSRSYHQALREKHPESPLAALSAIRDLDIEALKLTSAGKVNELPLLAQKLNQMNDRGNNEIKTQITLRKLFWNAKKINATKSSDLPSITPEIQSELTGWIPTIENPRTSFIALSLIANQLQLNPWDKNNSEFIGSYLEKYKDQKNTTWVEELKTTFEGKISQHLLSLANKGEYLGLIDTFEKLPKNLRTLADTPETAWSIAEAYRNLSKPIESLVFYRKAVQEKNQGSKLRANFWINVLNAEMLSQVHLNQASDEKIREELKSSERALSKTWVSLTDEEKNQFASAYKNHLEAAVEKKLTTPTVAKINLEVWEKALNTKMDVSSSSNDSWTKNWRPSATTVTFLKKLGDQFNQLGMPEEKQKTSQLITQIKPEILKDDSNAKTLWLNEVVSLAEEQRKANRYLEAGRLFASAANNAEQWDKKAEALYKGGLLLYRAGQREEAVKALQQASEDTNNIFYANLAKERLNQLEK